MTRKEQIKSAYKLTSGHASFYDGMMTYSTLPGKAICRIVWNMDGEKNLRYLEKALSGIPEDSSENLKFAANVPLRNAVRARKGQKLLKAVGLP